MQKIASVAAALSLLAVLAPAAHAATTVPYNTLTGNAPLVIGHRGAPAYLPENTIGGNELAARMGSDYIETDVMMTADKVLIAMHDLTLTRTTNVAQVYAPRNGGYAVEDFTYAELQALTVQPTGSGDWTYPGFAPADADPYRIPTFADMLDALTDYNAANGTNVGMLTEGKYAYDAATNRAVIETLIERGYDSPEKSIVQSFDFANVSEYAALLAEHGVDMGVAQLGGGNLIGDQWFIGTTASFETLAGYTDTVALYYQSITEGLIKAAHDLNLSVFAWTFRPIRANLRVRRAASVRDS
ncbi:MAG: glycerophosphodiester phosphodiesterase family protein [Paracoccus sp. (in: a-proteobacteria)]|uniref:glycerophosphodiester phosphodiesterase family protein n=1 Tax=Paracoccus sp. TaxID=267 RepID=UPI0026DF8408|nr:glycerophosphodiester phosphodiesterase family protein [Paracoccus sp. (in: a-proteobacteria)]MDO5613238.1 glycerophosphodiester phosphodiesterase family protein [Paracoccus sp. (in: a-proteobacteria)]